MEANTAGGGGIRQDGDGARITDPLVSYTDPTAHSPADFDLGNEDDWDSSPPRFMIHSEITTWGIKELHSYHKHGRMGHEHS